MRTKQRLVHSISKLVLLFAMILSVLSIPGMEKAVYAATDPIDPYLVTSGVFCKDGTNDITYQFDTTSKTMTISGTGAIKNFDYAKPAFKSGIEIHQVIVEEGITALGDGVFWSVAGLESVSLPKTLKTLRRPFYSTIVGGTGYTVAEGNEYYYSQDGCVYNPGMTTLYRYGGNHSDYTTPSTLERVSEGAFYSCKIGTLTLGGNQLQLGSYAISDGVSVDKLVLEEGFKGMGSYNSLNLLSDKTITLPASYVENIDPQSILNSKALEAIYVSEDNPRYISRDGVLIEKATGAMKVYPRAKTDVSYKTAPEIKSISEYAFGINQYNTCIKTLILSVQVEEVEESSIRPQLDVLIVENKNLDLEVEPFHSVSERPATIKAFGGSKAQVYANVYGIGFIPYTATIDGTTSDVSGIDAEYQYSGSPITPEPTIKYGGVMELVKGTDYDLNYVDNTDIGTATIQIIGLGDFTTMGTYDVQFDIVACIHSFTQSTVTTPETCTANGVLHLVCDDCGYEWDEVIPMGHDLVHHAAQSASCTEIGWDAYDTCSRCDYTTYSEIGMLPHDLEYHTDAAASCTSDGWSDFVTCNNCSYRTYTVVPATGHSYTKYVTPATPEDDGYILETCFCGDIKVTPFSRPSNVSLSLTEYIYDGTEKNPTLIVKDAKGNTLVEGTDYTVSVPAGRTEVGTYAYVVDFMGNYIGTTTVDFVIKPEEPVHTHCYSPTYGYDDTEHYTECECGAKNEVAAHVFEWATEKIATEFEEGSKYEKCEICGYRRASVVVEKLPHTHSYSTSWYSDDDNHWKECACGENDELAVHTFDEGIVTKEETESEEGTKTYTCTICSATKLETIPKLSAAPGTSTKPSADPSTKPSTDPSADPGVSPSTKPSTDPSADPGVSPSTKPSADPSTAPSPSVKPSADPSAVPGASVKPSVNPSTKPSQAPVVTLKNQKITTAKMKAVKASVLSKKAVKVKLNAKTDGNGKLTYKVTKYPKKMNKFIKVSKKGVVTFKKNAKKGTYKITITADAKGEYQKTTKFVSIKVK